MSNPQLLNLDELAPVRRQVTLNGKVYPVKEMTVEHFVELNKFADELEAKQDMTPVESVQATVRTVAMSLEGCDEATVRALSLVQLGALSQFIRGEFAPAAAADEGDEGNVQAQPTMD